MKDKDTVIKLRKAKFTGKVPTGLEGVDATSKVKARLMPAGTNRGVELKLSRPLEKTAQRSDFRLEKQVSGCPSRQQIRRKSESYGRFPRTREAQPTLLSNFVPRQVLRYSPSSKSQVKNLLSDLELGTLNLELSASFCRRPTCLTHCARHVRFSSSSTSIIYSVPRSHFRESGEPLDYCARNT